MNSQTDRRVIQIIKKKIKMRARVSRLTYCVFAKCDVSSRYKSSRKYKFEIFPFYTLLLSF